jgi:hypothetical protein
MREVEIDDWDDAPPRDAESAADPDAPQRVMVT